MKLMILDGNSIINRAYFGIRPLTTRDGLYTHAIFGFLNILQRLEHEEEPDALCVAFDLHGPTFRHEKYEGYKATRHGMPEELAMQMPVMKDVLRAMNIPIFACQGWEADDVIGTVGKRCAEENWDCVIVTGDRDSLQLIDRRVHVKLITTKAGQTLTTLYDEEAFREEYGFAPIHLIDLKGLMGDSSDNIPGVAGVGPKTATQLLQQFGTLTGVYENLEDKSIRPKLREKLEAGKDLAFLSYDLATIRCDAPVEFDPNECLRKPVNGKALYDLFLRLEFTKLIDRYGLRKCAFEADCVPEEAQEECRKELSELPSADTPCAVLIKDDRIALATEDGTICVPLSENIEYFKTLFGNKTEKTCLDLKNLYHTLAALDLPAEGFAFDAALACYVLDPTVGDYSLEKIALQYLSRELNDDLSERVWALWQLRPVLQEKLKVLSLETVYYDIELPLCRVLARMEEEGVAVDQAALSEFGAMLNERIAACQSAIFEMAGEEFNINSTKKLGEILFEKLELPPVKKTKTGYSTNAEVLEKLKDRHPIVAHIMEYRMLTKLSSTYAEGLLRVIAPDGRIHTRLQNMVTATGRLSSTEPNLQNIPVRTELGSEIRKMFVARPGWVLVDADYSQIELRVLAHIADDPHMQNAFRSGQDFHKVTASQVFGVPLEEVTPAMRRSAKAVNFGIVYGISRWSLAEDLGVSTWEAEEYINSYLARFAGVRRYMHDVVENAKRDGYVTTIFGRRRNIPELKSSNFNIRSGAERIALNTPVQGSAADIIKLAMLRVSKALEEEALQARLVLQVHDELIVECPPWEAEMISGIVTREMEKAAQLSLPLVAEAKQGMSWYEAK
ncbi:MAG: DNA polymerase I [Ruminococcaceae bacterium]|nr:DNA polymerase I [Oscillospiraceae bacterium]